MKDKTIWNLMAIRFAGIFFDVLYVICDRDRIMLRLAERGFSACFLRPKCNFCAFVCEWQMFNGLFCISSIICI